MAQYETESVMPKFNTNLTMLVNEVLEGLGWHVLSLNVQADATNSPEPQRTGA
jgi:hypothetical protein